MTNKNKKELIDKLTNFHNSAKELLDVIYDMEGEFNELKSIEVYPFEKSYDEVVTDIGTFVDTVREELAAVESIGNVRNVKNHWLIVDNKNYFTAQVTDEEVGKTYDMNVIFVEEEPSDETEVVPFKIANYYHGEPSVEDTVSYIDDWKKECATMQRVKKYLEAYLLTNEGCFGEQRDENDIFYEPLVRQTLEELRDIIMYHF